MPHNAADDSSARPEASGAPAKPAASRGRCCLGRMGALAGPILGLSAIVLIWIASFYFIEHERRHTQGSASQTAVNLARAFEEQLIRTLRGIDQTLLYVREKYEENPGHFDIASWTGDSTLLTGTNFRTAVIDQSGQMVASNISGLRRGVDLSDRDYFVAQAKGKSDAFYVGAPVLNRFSNQWSIQFSRPIIRADGSFGGVAVASIGVDEIASFYQSIDLGQGGVVTLVGTDGIVRAWTSAGGNMAAMSLLRSRLFAVLPHADNGIFEDRSEIDGVQRLSAFRKVRDYPLVMVVGISRETMLKDVRAIGRDIMIISVILSLGIAGTTLLLWRYQLALARSRDAAEAGTRARTEFLAMMSHEIRTPMNGVVGMSEVLMESGLNPQQLGFARTLRDSATHLLHLINDVLDFSKLEAGRVECERLGFDVHALIASSVDILAPTAAEKNLALTVDIAPDVPRRIVGDPARLRQVLFNLIGNGLKFTETGGVTVSVGVALTRMVPGHVRLAFAVRDTGIGIPKDGMPLLFKEFSQLDPSIARRFGGTGLGLAISRRLVSLMGGTLDVDSEVGKGSTFHFMLDCRVDLSAPDEAVVAEEATSRPSTDRRDLRILLVEDNDTNRQVFLALIERLGYRADVAVNGVEAVDACAQRLYDVVFMDVMMPGMDGLAATRAIRKLPAPFCSVRMIALTANAHAADRKACLDAGMNDFLSKPATRAALAGKLDRIAAGRQGRGPAPDGPAIAMAAEPPLFDRAVFNELRDAIGDDGIEAVLQAFVNEMPVRLAAMRRGAKEGRADAIRIEAHTVKSASSSIGFMRLSDLARALERDAVGLSAPALQARIGDIAAAFVAIEVLAHAELGALPRPDTALRADMTGAANG